MCPIIEDRYSHTRLKSDDPNGPDFREVSGLAFSPTQTHNGKPIFYAISDGGGDARIGIFDSRDGRRLKTLRIDRGFFRNADWEALTIGSCGKSGEGDNCLYIMDAGDNQARQNNGNRGRNNYRILKIREPRWTDYNDNDYISKSRMSRMDFDYRHSSSPTNYADCEAMFVDHKGWGSGERKGDIYLVTKWDRGNERSKTRLFRLPADAWSSGYDGAIRNYSLRAVGNYDYNRYERNGGMHLMKTTWSSGEMSFDGTMIAMGNLQKTYVFLRCPGTSVKDAIANPHANAKSCVDWHHPATGQVETLAWTPDRRFTLDIPEGNSPKMGWTKLRFDRNRSSRVCPGPPPPTRPPTRNPTPQPTRNPTPRPTPSPTLSVNPTRAPSPDPTRAPSVSPSRSPSNAPSTDPTQSPSASPSRSPSMGPTNSPSLSSNPTSCNGHIFDLILQTDEYGANTQWKVYNGIDEIVGEGSGYSRFSTIRQSLCLEAGLHSFEVSNEFVEGVPGMYQIWYDKVLLYDSEGPHGKFSQVMFATEFDDKSFAPKTPSPTQAPTATTENEIFGVSCGGICPGSEVANAQEVVRMGRNSGTEYFCGSLDKRYQQLFSTPDACEALQFAAQEAGCKCEAIGQVSSISEESTTMKAQESPSDETQMGLIFGVLAAFCIGGFCCYKCTSAAGKRKSQEKDNLMDTDVESGKEHDEEFGNDTSKTVSDDATANSGSDESSEMTMATHEKDELRPLPLLKTASFSGEFVAENDDRQLLPLRRVKTALGVSTPNNDDHQSTPTKSNVTAKNGNQVVPLRRVKTSSPPVVQENTVSRLFPIRRVQSAISQKFLQSWQVTMPEGGTDFSERSEAPSDEIMDVVEVGGDEKSPSDNNLETIVSGSYDEDDQLNVEVSLNLSEVSEDSAFVMEA